MSYPLSPINAQFNPYNSVEMGRVLSKNEAVARMQHLTPGSDEYNQIQHALVVKTSALAEIILPKSCYLISTFSEDQALLGGFGSSEHVAIGEKIKLPGLDITGRDPLLTVGSVPISFSEIIALAGDFYAIFGQAISLPGGDNQAKTKRFEKAFQTLADADPFQLKKIREAIQQECDLVKNHALPHHCYSNELMEKNKEIEVVKKDITDLLIDNSDHFSENAIEAYNIGHAEAIRMAQEAGSSSDRERLKRAYAFDAFACHFLTDLFAAGHVRNQRGKLEIHLSNALGFSSSEAKYLAGFLTAAQHEKDGNEGLNVFNKKGEQWRAYGDGCFFTPKNTENKQKVIEAVSKSVAEVYDAFLNYDNQIESQMELYFPYATAYNPPPVYSIKRNMLVFHNGTQETLIQNKHDCLLKSIPQALKHLPESYVQGFIKSLCTPSGFQIPQLYKGIVVTVEKAVVPFVEQFTSSIWHAVGIATYYQVKQQNQQQTARDDEMADIMRATYSNTVQILKEIREIRIDVRQVLWEMQHQAIRTSIEHIQQEITQYEQHTDTLNDDQKRAIQTTMWGSYIALFHKFSQEEAIVAFKQLFEQQNPSLSTDEIKIHATQWFNGILAYEIQAFSLYASLKAENHLEANNLREQAIEFEGAIRRQIEVNKNHLHFHSIGRSKRFTDLQLEKARTKKLLLQAVVTQ